MNNLNNFGMNQINLNNMPFNNAGMNNIPQNLINENNMNIQFQILNYENRIKELENIIEQKDVEIAFLKEKLNNNGFNFPMQNFMNMNNFNMNNFNMNMDQPNIMMQNQNNDISGGTQICVSFENIRNFICNDNDLAYTLIEKIMPNKNWFLLKFMCDEKEIYPFLRLNENGIKNGSIIRCNHAINLRFIDNINYPKPRLTCAVDENKISEKQLNIFY